MKMETIAKAHSLAEELCTLLTAALNDMPAAARNPYAKVRERHPNAGKPWNAKDDEELRRLYTSGTALDDLSLFFGRTPNGVRVRLERLGLVEPAAAASAA